MPSEPPGPKPPSPGTLLIRSNWTVDTKSWSFLFHVAKALLSAWSGADISEVLTNFASALTSELIPLYGPSVSHVNNEATDLTSDMGLQVTGTSVGDGTAEGKTMPLPINVALFVHTPTILRVRGGRFGMNFAGLDQTDRLASSSTMWSTTTQLAWSDALAQVLNMMSGLALPSGDVANPVVVSYYYKFAFREPPLVLPLNSFAATCQQRICTRRRRLGRGVAGE